MAEKQYIIFRLNDEKFAANINQIASISEYASITALPDAPAYVDGLLNLRGDIIPVINLKKRFNLEEQRMNQKRILISQSQGRHIGFLVDDASQSMSVDVANVLPAPMIAIKRDNDYISEVCIHKDELIIVVDLERVLSSDEVDKLTGL